MASPPTFPDRLKRSRRYDMPAVSRPPPQGPKPLDIGRINEAAKRPRSTANIASIAMRRSN